MTVPSGKRFGLGQSAGLSQVHGQSPPQQASFENLVFWGRLHLVDDYGGDEVDDDEDDDANDDEEDVINKTWPQILISWHQFKTWPQNLINWHQFKTWPQMLIKWHQFKSWPQKLIRWHQKLISWHQFNVCLSRALFSPI